METTHLVETHTPEWFPGADSPTDCAHFCVEVLMPASCTYFCTRLVLVRMNWEVALRKVCVPLPLLPLVSRREFPGFSQRILGGFCVWEISSDPPLCFLSRVKSRTSQGLEGSPPTSIA